MDSTQVTHPILRLLAQDINGKDALDFCEGAEYSATFTVYADGEGFRVDLVRSDIDDVFTGVLRISVGAEAATEHDKRWWAWDSSGIDSRSQKGYEMPRWVRAACCEMVDYVKLALKRDWRDASMTVAAPLVNLTPHPIHVLDGDDNILLTIPVSGLPVPRAQKITTAVAEVVMDGVAIPLLRPSFGQVLNLPDPVAGTLYIVSLIVQQACPDRRDLVIVEDVVRDGSTIKGCRAFGI